MSEAPRLTARLRARAGTLALDVELALGESPLVLVGPNGAGKTSVLSALLGVLPLDSGHIQLGGRVLFDDAAGIDVPLEARQLGYVPQDYALFPHLSVRQNLEFALRSSGVRGKEVGERALRVLSDLELTALSQRRATALSGGEKQRVALARALSVRPRALLLDEPLAALDVSARRETRAFLAGYLRRLALPTLVVTHDPADARALGGQIAVLEAGRIVQTGSWEELHAQPGSEFVRELLSA